MYLTGVNASASERQVAKGITASHLPPAYHHLLHFIYFARAEVGCQYCNKKKITQNKN